MWRVVRDEPRFTRWVGAAAPTSIRQHLGAAFSFIRERRAIATLLVVGFGNSFAFGIVIGLVVPYAVEALGVAEDGAGIGFLYAAVGVGSLVSGIAFSRLYADRRVRIITPSMLASAAVGAAVLSIVSDLVPAIVVFVIFSAAITTTITTGITYRQLAAPDRLRSSVNVIGRMVAWGGQPVGALTGAALVGALSVRGVYGVAAAVMGVSALVAAARLLPIDTSLPRASASEVVA